MSNSKDNDSIPSITPARDEVASYRRSSRGEAPKQVNFNGLLVFVIVVMAIMMAVGGYALYQVQQRLEESNVLLTKGQENVRMLEERLQATGTDVSKTLSTVQGRLDTNENEIRKLWDVSNKRNKQWIRDNEEAVANLKSTQSNVSGRVNDLQGNISKIVSRFNELANEMTTVRDDLLDSNEEMSTRISMLQGQVEDQAVQVESHNRSVNSLNQQVKRNEEAIEAIDRYRQQVNQRLRELQAQVQSGNSGASSGGGP
ncbi:MAG: hypothetical protein WD356_07715 [Pseudomonadales bacterium]